jgi:murein DD-endopeptidase MepM/ murein hydrolase activator NlpD
MTPPVLAFRPGSWARALLWLTLIALCLPGLWPAGPARAAAQVAGPRSVAVPWTAWHWPLDGHPVVVRGFDPPTQPWLPGHRGVDLAGSVGAPVYAAGTGRVVFAGTVAGRGVVSVDHGDGLRTTYEPVRPVVHAGERVSAGQLIGHLSAGHPGCPVTACLHWGLRHADEYLNPLLVVVRLPVRLKPLDGTDGGSPVDGLAGRQPVPVGVLDDQAQLDQRR